MRPWRIVGLAALLVGTGAAPAFSASIDACEKIKDADAYNNCLAGFGPAANSAPLSHAIANESSGDVGAAAKPVGKQRAAAKAQKQAAASAGPKIIRSAPGRMRMELMIPAAR